MPEIKVGNTEGQYFTQWRFNILTELAGELEKLGATDFEMWYDAYEDFHKLSFLMDGHKYVVRYYKVFAVQREGSTLSHVFGFDYDFLVRTFRRGEHKEWE